MLVAWAHRPRDPQQLFRIMEETRDDELELLAYRVGGPGGFLAWAELGKRRYGLEYGVTPGEAKPWILMGCYGTC